MAFNYSPKIFTDNLRFYYDGANKKCYSGTGTSLRDLSKTENNGTLNNSPSYTTDNLGSIVFDGTNDHVSVTDSTSLRITNTITLETCFKMTTKGTYNTIICKPATNAPWSPPYLSYMLRVQVTEVQFGYNRNSTYSAVNHTFNYLINTIYHLICTLDLSTGVCNMYLNGTQVVNTGVTSGGSISYGTQPLLIGAGFGSSPIGEVFTGNIYNVKIYDKVLSSSEALRNYNTIKSRFNL